MDEVLTLQVHGEVELRSYPLNTDTIISMHLPDNITGSAVNVEFRQADFIRFARYLGGVAEELARGTPN